MTQAAMNVALDLDPLDGPQEAAPFRSVPRITIQAFCDTPEIMGTIETAASDRRMARAHVKVHTGGIAAAVEFYANAPTPNLIILETCLTRNEILAGLGQLAEVCDEGTKVLIIGPSNDVTLYRELIRQGVSEYVVAPVDVMSIIATISDLYGDDSEEKLGQSYVFVGSKGGAGSSTIAHNVAWAMARNFSSDVILADLDLAFGTASLDFNEEPGQGIADAVADPDRLDEMLLDRLLTKCHEHLSLLAAPATLDQEYDLDVAALQHLFEVMQKNVPNVVVDLPHLWTSWAKKTLLTADEIVVTATPDLASLRNTKNIIDSLKAARPNDGPPRLVLNQTGMPKRPEISIEDFVSAVEIEPIANIAFDPLLFGTAANNGQMIAEASAKAATAVTFEEIAQIVSHRKEITRPKKSILESVVDWLKQK